jgi:hypothetical protein
MNKSGNPAFWKVQELKFDPRMTFTFNQSSVTAIEQRALSASWAYQIHIVHEILCGIESVNLNEAGIEYRVEKK